MVNDDLDIGRYPGRTDFDDFEIDEFDGEDDFDDWLRDDWECFEADTPGE